MFVFFVQPSYLHLQPCWATPVRSTAFLIEGGLLPVILSPVDGNGVRAYVEITVLAVLLDGNLELEFCSVWIITMGIIWENKIKRSLINGRSYKPLIWVKRQSSPSSSKTPIQRVESKFGWKARILVRKGRWSKKFQIVSEVYKILGLFRLNSW